MNTRQQGLASHYQTSCSICRLGIFDGQPAVWTRGTHLGVSHLACAQATCPRCDGPLSLTDVELCLACVVTAERFGDMRELAAELFVRGTRVKP
jgi:hypothetical protein